MDSRTVFRWCGFVRFQVPRHPPMVEMAASWLQSRRMPSPVVRDVPQLGIARALHGSRVVTRTKPHRLRYRSKGHATLPHVVKFSGGRVPGQTPQCLPVPVLAIEAQTLHGASTAAEPPGHKSYLVLGARGATRSLPAVCPLRTSRHGVLEMGTGAAVRHWRARCGRPFR